MIIEFQVKNYLSFKDLTIFSMVGMKSFKEHEPDNVIQFDEKFKILKSAAIYGSNGSGKSNFVKSLAFMKGLILNSFRDTLLEENNTKIPLKKFLLNKECDILPSHFELSFIVDKTIYRYGFEIESEKISKEWLYHTTSKETPLFTRDNNKIVVNKSSFKEGLGLESKIKDSVLFLTRIAHDEGSISNQIISWIKKFNVINGINDMSYKLYTVKKLKEDINFQSWVSKFVTFLEISKLSTEEKEILDIDFESIKRADNNEELIDLLSNIQKIQAKQPKSDKIITWHKKYDVNNFLIDTIPFNFDEQESEGTKKLVYLLGPWYDTLKGGKVLIVDELDSRLHTNLIKYLVKFFHQSNDSNAQLIFVTHNTDLLSKDYLRRDQIWFIEKNQFGSSEMYSLGDFKSEQVRKKSAFDKNYIEGKYGAVPLFDDNNKLIDLLHGQE